MILRLSYDIRIFLRTFKFILIVSLKFCRGYMFLTTTNFGERFFFLRFENKILAFSKENIACRIWWKTIKIYILLISTETIETYDKQKCFQSPFMNIENIDSIMPLNTGLRRKPHRWNISMYGRVSIRLEKNHPLREPPICQMSTLLAMM